jgi:uncharacterized membrane protein YphA (DoxX/SURF4 family)
MTTTGTPDVGNRTAAGSVARDLVLLLARIGLGVLMVAHAKLEYDFAGGSIAGVGALFEKSGIPLAAITGPVNMLFELVGGAAMILGLAVLPVGVLMALNMLGAWILVHHGHRAWTSEPGARRLGRWTAGARPPHRPARPASVPHGIRGYLLVRYENSECGVALLTIAEKPSQKAVRPSQTASVNFARRRGCVQTADAAIWAFK